MTDTKDLYESIMTDDLMFALEPGTASRTKFAVMILQKIDKLDLPSLDSEQQENINAIKTRASEFLT